MSITRAYIQQGPNHFPLQIADLGTFNTCYNDAGLFGLYLMAPPETLRDLTEACCRSP